jgi:phosphoglycolate phosphatase
MNKEQKTILFDLDGTLIDSTDAIVESFYYAFDDQNFEFKGEAQDIINLIGYPLDYKFSQLGVDENRVWDFVDSYKENYRKISENKTVLLENAKESVELAASFARLAVVTTKTTKYTIPLLKKLQLFDYFETIIGRQEVENPKPHPEPIYKALENLNLKPSKNIFMIGDTKLDLIAANKANISAFGVLCGYGKKVELLSYTDEIYEDALSAVKKIKNI